MLKLLFGIALALLLLPFIIAGLAVLALCLLLAIPFGWLLILFGLILILAGIAMLIL
jgi:hypothetical protein